jgi:hypothetical protein
VIVAGHHGDLAPAAMMSAAVVLVLMWPVEAGDAVLVRPAGEPSFQP